MDPRPNPLRPYLQRIAGVMPRVLEIPDALHAARRAQVEDERTVSATRKRRDEAKEAVKDSENEVAIEVVADKAFTNADGRKAEAQRRLRERPAHKALVAAVDKLDAELFDAEHALRLHTLDVKKLEDEQRALQTYSDFTLSQTALLTAGR